jgi:hypothetical protein
MDTSQATSSGSDLPPGATPASGAGDVGRSVSTPLSTVQLQRRREELGRRVAELQWDLGGLVHEMAIRDYIRVEVLVQRATVLQEASAELAEVERIQHLEETGAAGACAGCGAPHSSGATYCWQCGQALLEQVSSAAIGAR